MRDKKYIIATEENPFHIEVRNILNPCGYVFIERCSNPAFLIRMVRNYHPDFVVVDDTMNLGQLRVVLETIDEEMLCACIIAGGQKPGLDEILENSRVIMLCTKPVNRDILINTVEMANLSFARVSRLAHQLREMTENFETRKTMDIAKALLIKRHGIGEKEAYGRIRTRSMDMRVSMKEVAQAIIEHENMKRR